MTIRILVWDELTAPKEVYPEGIHEVIARHLNACDGISARAVSIDDPDQGLLESDLEEADVLIWWGHLRHGEVSDESTARVIRHVTVRGMGFIALHSAQGSRPLQALLGTSCGVGSWREDGKPERIWVIEPDHPIAAGLPGDFILPETEMYGERFDIPAPEELVFISHFEPGEVFRSGCCWTRGKGRIFYFRPGHETYRIYDNPHIQRVLENAVRWAAR